MNAFNSIFKYTLISGAVILGGASLFAYSTKPTDDSFNEYIETIINDNYNRKPNHK